MINRESIIDHLDDLRMFADLIVRPLVSPENRNVYSKLYNYIDLIKDEVETLLKEQEAVEARKENDGKPKPWTSWWYICGDCGQAIEYRDRFCRWCGRQVKWDDT